VTNRKQLHAALPDAGRHAGTSLGLPPALPDALRYPNLHQLLHRHGPFAPGTAILGACPDRSPLVLDLSDPESGAVLISSPQSDEAARLLRAILASTIVLNKPHQLAIHIIADSPRRYDDFFPSEHVRQLIAADDPLVNSAVLELLPEYGLYSANRHAAKITILAIDNLQALSERLDKQAYAALCWLARHGSRLKIWLLATQAPGHLDEIDDLLLSAMRTRLADYPSADGSPGFLLSLDDETIPFRICDPG
jgi:hypothetical protein